MKADVRYRLRVRVTRGAADRNLRTRRTDRTRYRASHAGDSQAYPAPPRRMPVVNSLAGALEGKTTIRSCPDGDSKKAARRGRRQPDHDAQYECPCACEN